MSGPEEPVPHADIADELEQALPVTESEDDEDYPHTVREADLEDPGIVGSIQYE